MMFQKSDKDKLEDEVQRLAKVMGMFLWEIKIEWRPTLEGGDALALAFPTDNMASGIIQFSEELLAEPWRKQQEIVLHELLHFVHKDVTESLYGSVRALDIPENEKKQLWESFHHRVERFVDHMSRVLRPLI